MWTGLPAGVGVRACDRSQERNCMPAPPAGPDDWQLRLLDQTRMALVCGPNATQGEGSSVARLSVRMTGGRRLASAFGVACALVWWGAAAPAKAEPGFPNRTMRIFVPYGPG